MGKQIIEMFNYEENVLKESYHAEWSEKFLVNGNYLTHIYLSKLITCDYSDWVKQGFVYEVFLFDIKVTENVEKNNKLAAVFSDKYLRKEEYSKNSFFYFGSLDEAMEFIEKLKEIYTEIVKAG